MAVRVNIALSSSCKPRTVCEFVVLPRETVSSIKQRIAYVSEVPFPDQDLFYDGVALKDNCTLIDDCGLTQGASLYFEPQATTAVLVQQLSKLLQAKSLPVDELGLIYALTNGGSVSRAMKMVGLSCTLVEFLQTQKCFAINGTSVTLLTAPSNVAPETFVQDGIVSIPPPPGLSTEEEDRVDVSAWRSVGASVFAALRDSMDDDDTDDERPKPIPSNDIEADCHIDREAWRSVGSRMRNVFAAAHGDSGDDDDEDSSCGFAPIQPLKCSVKTDVDEDTGVGSVTHQDVNVLPLTTPPSPMAVDGGRQYNTSLKQLSTLAGLCRDTFWLPM